MVYLDTAATTKPRQETIAAMMPYLTDKWQNPSSLYSSAAKVKKDIEKARKTVANFIGANANEIYFTSGACESNNMVIRGWDDAVHCSEDRLEKLPDVKSCIITTQIEHKSMIEAVSNPMLYSDVYFCDVDEFGRVNLHSLTKYLDDYKGCPILVSIGLANSEIGVIQNMRAISNLVHSYNGVLHTDATQAIAHIPVLVDEFGVDMLSASAQKFGGLKGSGFLYKKNNVNLMPLIYGSQERGLRGGTENVIGIIALAKAIELAKIDVINYARMSFIRDYFIKELVSIGCKVNGDTSRRLPNNINIVLPYNISGESMLYMLDMCGICVSTGSACDSHSVNPSYVLKSIGKVNDASSSIRITFDSNITSCDVDKVVNEIKTQIELLKE